MNNHLCVHRDHKFPETGESTAGRVFINLNVAQAYEEQMPLYLVWRSI
jgi:hypothetical protein